VCESPADDIADLELGDALSDLLDRPDTFVSEPHVGVLVVLVRATDPRVRYFDEDLVSGGPVMARFGLYDTIVG
jgi:hypothetical protein